MVEWVGTSPICMCWTCHLKAKEDHARNMAVYNRFAFLKDNLDLKIILII